VNGLLKASLCGTLPHKGATYWLSGDHGRSIVDDKQSEVRQSSVGLGIALGTALGVAVGAGVGVALGNLALGIGLGIALGLAIGVILGDKHAKAAHE